MEAVTMEDDKDAKMALLQPPAEDDRRRRQTRAGLAELWERFKGTILERVAVLEQAAVALLEGGLDPELRQRAQREAHKLAGSVGSFGFARGSQLAREIEYLLQAGTEINPTQALRLSDLVVSLGRELERPPAAQPAPSAPSAGASPLLLLIGVEAELADRLAIEASAQGLRTRLAETAAEARRQLAEAQPQAALLDLSADPGEDGLVLLKELGGRQPPLPVLVLAGEDSFADRVEVARLGGRAYLQKPASPAQVLAAVTLALQRLQAGTAKILAVDDDPQVLAVLRSLLSPRDIRLTTLEDPRQFWEVLRETEPDLLILDMEMPYLNGIELCQVVRNDPRWHGLPVLFLTAYATAEAIQRIFAAGADDFVNKPLVGPELVSRIANRLERSRLLQAMTETDALTGLANRRKAVQELNRLLQLAGRQEQPLSLAVLDLDQFKDINARHGHACGDQVLRRMGGLLLKTFRSEDVLARWAGEEFVVGMYGMPRSAAVQRLAEMLERLRRESFAGAGGEPFCVAFSAGVAEYPADGRDLDSLYRVADHALGAAKEAGRGRVLPAGWHEARQHSAQAVDVVLVDDDETLADLLRHALETCGLRAQVLNDGQSAVEALGGPSPSLQARLVLLDVDLPGLNGLSVLRRLARDGALRRSKVIMLTARSTEAEVLEALRLGAMDHVAKPFSLPVLMQRIRQTLSD